MKFASFPKFSVLSLLAGVFALALAGCGGTSNMALTQGNWAVAASSSQSANTFSIGGNLTQSGSKVSGTMYITESSLLRFLAARCDYGDGQGQPCHAHLSRRRRTGDHGDGDGDIRLSSGRHVHRSGWVLRWRQRIGQR